ncbi:MAG: DUF423 domain-containing protein [Roseiarcus sp.]|jgi:uncharacterized membrane protein YgdD (TMEM256/DUF423 family)
MHRPVLALGALAALMGAAGVALAAAAAHRGGGDFAQTAAYFLILHAAALLGVAAAARGFSDRPSLARALVAAGGALGLGAILFSADLATRAFSGDRLFPMAAPAGGSLTILGWLALAAVFVAGALRRPG